MFIVTQNGRILIVEQIQEIGKSPDGHGISAYYSVQNDDRVSVASFRISSDCDIILPEIKMALLKGLNICCCSEDYIKTASQHFLEVKTYPCSDIKSAVVGNTMYFHIV